MTQSKGEELSRFERIFWMMCHDQSQIARLIDGNLLEADEIIRVLDRIISSPSSSFIADAAIKCEKLTFDQKLHVIIKMKRGYVAGDLIQKGNLTAEQILKAVEASGYERWTVQYALKAGKLTASQMALIIKMVQSEDDRAELRKVMLERV